MNALIIDDGKRNAGLSRRRVDLVQMAQMIPEMDGISFLHNRFQDTPIPGQEIAMVADLRWGRRE